MLSKLTEITCVRAHKAKEIGLPKESGIYKWWCDEVQLKQFWKQLNTNTNLDDAFQYIEQAEYNGKKYYCFYVGQTKSSLSSRIKSQHIGKRNKINPTAGRAIRGSTLRQSINALKNGKNVFDENYVDDVLDNCLVQWEEIEKERIDATEREYINSHIRILNRDDFLLLKDKNMQKLRDDIACALKSARSRQ